MGTRRERKLRHSLVECQEGPEVYYATTVCARPRIFCCLENPSLPRFLLFPATNLPSFVSLLLVKYDGVYKRHNVIRHVYGDSSYGSLRGGLLACRTYVKIVAPCERRHGGSQAAGTETLPGYGRRVPRHYIMLPSVQDFVSIFCLENPLFLVTSCCCQSNHPLFLSMGRIQRFL